MEENRLLVWPLSWLLIQQVLFDSVYDYGLYVITASKNVLIMIKRKAWQLFCFFLSCIKFFLA